MMEDVGCLMLINDNANLNNNELSAECVLQLIESPCRREIGQIEMSVDGSMSLIEIPFVRISV